MRLFVALELSDAVKSALIAAQRESKQWLPPGCLNWTRLDALHLTLRFLGNVPEAKLVDLKASLAEAVSKHHVIELTCEGLDCFPDRRFPRVLWAGVHETLDGSVASTPSNSEPERLADARREIRRRSSAALPKLGRADLPVRRDFPPASAATLAAGRPDDSSVPNPAGGNAREPTGLPGLQADALNRLQAAVSSACDPFAEKPDVQPFAGHVTLGRFRRLGREDSERVARVIGQLADRLFGKWTADEVVLFRSELRPEGAKHFPIGRFILRPEELSR